MAETTQKGRTVNSLKGDLGISGRNKPVTTKWGL